MNNGELYDAARYAYKEGDLQSWIARQDDDVICRLYVWLSNEMNSTVVVERDADFLLAWLSDEDRVVVRNENGMEGCYLWDDWCSDTSILASAAAAVSQRLHERVLRIGCSPSENGSPISRSWRSALESYLVLLLKQKWSWDKLAAAPMASRRSGGSAVELCPDTKPTATGD